MKNVSKNNSMFVKVMAGILAGLMILSAVATAIIILVQ